jgi:hypothetical protein
MAVALSSYETKDYKMYSKRTEDVAVSLSIARRKNTKAPFILFYFQNETIAIIPHLSKL